MSHHPNVDGGPGGRQVPAVDRPSRVVDRGWAEVGGVRLRGDSSPGGWFAAHGLRHSAVVGQQQFGPGAVVARGLLASSTNFLEKIFKFLFVGRVTVIVYLLVSLPFFL